MQTYFFKQKPTSGKHVPGTDTSSPTFMKGDFIRLAFILVLILNVATVSAQTYWEVGGNNVGASSTPVTIGTTSPTPVSIISDNNEGLYIHTNGKVTIGASHTINDNFLFSVDGAMRAREIRVNPDAWADHVFGDSYNLIALNDLEKYINKEGHLPNVPTENEVLENGIDVGEMNALLLLKVEELTLYIIELNKRIEQLEQEEQR